MEPFNRNPAVKCLLLSKGCGSAGLKPHCSDAHGPNGAILVPIPGCSSAGAGVALRTHKALLHHASSVRWLSGGEDITAPSIQTWLVETSAGNSSGGAAASRHLAASVQLGSRSPGGCACRDARCHLACVQLRDCFLMVSPPPSMRLRAVPRPSLEASPNVGVCCGRPEDLQPRQSRGQGGLQRQPLKELWGPTRAERADSNVDEACLTRTSGRSSWTRAFMCMPRRNRAQSSPYFIGTPTSGRR